MKTTLFALFFLIILGFFGWGLYSLSLAIIGIFRQLDATVAAGILAAVGTIFGSTLTVVLGKYYERKRDIEAHYRAKKTEIYDEFLTEIWAIFFSDDDPDNDNEDQGTLISFMREWQRKLVLWGGQDVLNKHIVWTKILAQGEPNAQSFFTMEDLFRSIRKDIGHSNWKIPKGAFVHLFLQNSALFLELAKENPNVTLAEMAKREEELKVSAQE